MKKLKKVSATFIVFLIVALMLCILSAIFSLKDIQYNNYLERAKNLNISMSKIGEHLNIAFQIRWDRTHSLTSRIQRFNGTSVDELIKLLNDIYLETGVDFRVIDDDGIAYYHNGMQEYWKDHRAVTSMSETFILSPLQFGLTNEKYMKYIVPLKEPVVIGDVKIIYTVFTEPLSALRRDFDTSNYGEGCLSFIIDKKGTFIYENGSGDRMADSYNFLAYIEKSVTFKYNETFMEFSDGINNGINDTVLIEYNGKNYYISHFDLAMENWASILLVPEENIQAESGDFAQKLSGNIAVIFATAFLMFIIGFLYMWKKTITKQRLAVEAERSSNEAKTNFLSSMSHDIRTPMNAIIGMTEIALHNRKDIPKPVQEDLEKIRLSSTHMLMLVNDILDISKIESGKMSLNIAEFSMVETTNTLANLLRPLAKDKNIDLRMHTYNYRQEYLLGDELRISQVCINLATNAIKYTQNGGRVDIDFIQKFIDKIPDKVCVTCIVRDNGIGMSEEFQKIMYESFSRATDSRVNKVAGSGLGLAICHKMVQMMGGRLDCESTLGKGTTFTATLVLDKGKPDEVFELPNMRILVVDRDTVSTDALKRVFKRLSVEADIINDPKALPMALERNKDYQVAFVELGTPNNSGLCIVQMLHNHFGENFPIVLTDIADMGEYSEQIASLGVKLTMNKPYFYRIVYQTILNALKKGTPDDVIHNHNKEQSVAGMNVLVAEDNDLNWDILRELLRINGISATRAENGKICVDTLESARKNQFSVVLMDIRMPIMDGHEATRIIRKSKKAWVRTIPIIAMTADTFAEDIHQCIKSGMDMHLSKPINIGKLLFSLSNIKNKSDFQKSDDADS